METLLRILKKVTTYTFIGYAIFMIRWVGGFPTLIILMSISLTVTAAIYCCRAIDSFLQRRKKSNK